MCFEYTAKTRSFRKDLEELLKKHGIKDYSLSSSGSYTTATDHWFWDVDDDYKNGDLTAEIIVKMMLSKDEFKFDSCESLMTHIKARETVTEV